MFCFRITVKPADYHRPAACSVRSRRLPTSPAPAPRSKSQGAKVYSTARSFCREALAAAVACARKLVGLAGGPVVMDDPRWFLETFVVKMASPLLLGDAVGAMRAASVAARGMGTAAEGGEERGPDGNTPSGMETSLREVVLPGAVGRLIKVSLLLWR